MAIPRGYPNKGNQYSNLVGPVKVDVQFTVSSTDTGGAGITSLKSNGYVQSVFMNTSATPATGSPNPAAGYVQITMNNNFNKFISLRGSCQAPLAGSELAVTSGRTAGLVYTITTVGTTTAAEWLAFGLPAGLTPTVGQTFVALTTGTGGSHTGKVKVPGVSLIGAIETIGDPNQSISNSAIAVNGGAVVIAQFLGATAAGTTTPVAKAPADGTVVRLTLSFDNSSVSIDGL